MSNSVRTVHFGKVEGEGTFQLSILRSPEAKRLGESIKMSKAEMRTFLLNSLNFLEAN